MEMMSSSSWVFITAIVVVASIYYLYRQGRIPWLNGVRFPKMSRLFPPSAEAQADLLEKMEKATDKEIAKGKRLQAVLNAKRGLAEARAENIRLQREIDEVNEKSVSREGRAKARVQEEPKVKPRRL